MLKYYFVCCALVACISPAKAFAQLALDTPAVSSAEGEVTDAHAHMDEAYRCKGDNDLEGARAAFRAALRAGANAQVVWLELGYLAGAQQNVPAARDAFQRSLAGSDVALSSEARRELARLDTPPPSAAEPNADADDMLALGYRRKESRDYQGAEAAFRAARTAGADAQLVALELAFVAQDRHDTFRAKAELLAATQGPNAARRKQAESELSALRSTQGVASRHFWADLYAEAFGWSRVVGASHESDLVPSARVRGYYTPFAALELHLFVFGQITRDVASRGPDQSGLPRIYADNTALFGPGLLFRFWKHRVGVFAQLGPAIELVDSTRKRVQFDARIGAHLGLESSHCWPAVTSGSRWENALCHELYAEVTYVNRYQNDVFGFARGRSSWGIAITGPVEWQLAAELRVAKDLNGDYYNNFIDAGFGPRWRLLAPVHIDLMLAPHLGSYFGEHSVDPAPDPLHYLDLRVSAATYIEF